MGVGAAGGETVERVNGYSCEVVVAVGAPRASKAFGILGPLEVSVAGTAVRIQGGRRRALLARLLVGANEVVSAERLIEDLWADAVPAKPLNALQSCVSHLRSVLEGTRSARGPGTVLLTNGPGYLLRVAEHELDALRFGKLVDEGRVALGSSHMEKASEHFERSMSLWRGPVLAEFADEPWAVVEAARLEEMRLTAVEDGVEARLALGLHQTAVSELEAAVAIHPLRERLWAQLMLALYRCNRQAEALRAFGELRRMLGREMGIEPSAELRRLEEAILLQKPELDWHPTEDRVVLERVPTANPNNLPASLSSFVGRQAERSALRTLLRSTRLLTITGPGGAGKTRLALEVGADVLDDYPEGVWVVELAPTTDPSLMPSQVRTALGLIDESQGSPVDTITRHLRPRKALLVLDNCEHLIEPCAALAAELLRGCPQLRILATSRERLGIDGETAWRVPSLSLPQPGALPENEPLTRSDAVQLFVERAVAARGGVVLSEADEGAVVDICRRLEGFPLALELAAARANVLTLPEIAARLSESFALLVTGSRSAGRHRTLRAAFDWTYAALSEPERCLFERVSVFAGSFTLDAAEQVCAGGGIAPHDILDLLGALTDKSVVLATERTGRSRYRLLETLRQYGCEKLRERAVDERPRDGHLSWAVSLCEAAEAELCGRHVRRWLETLDDEYENLQAALVWAEDQGRHESAVRLAVGLRLYWEMRGRVGEGRAWLGRILTEGSNLDPLFKARALTAASSLAFLQADGHDAERLACESLALAESLASHRDITRALLALGNAAIQQAWMATDQRRQPHSERIAEVSLDVLPEYVTVWSDDLSRATAAFEKALALARETGDLFTTARALVNLGYVATCQGDLATALPLLEESLAMRREMGNPAYVGRSLSFLGLAVHRDGHLEDAQVLLEESVATLREVGDDRGLCEALSRHAEILKAAKDFQSAARAYREASGISARLGRVKGAISSLVNAGEMAMLAGDPGNGGYLLGVAQALLSGGEFVSGYGIENRLRHEQLVVDLRNIRISDRDFGLAFDRAKRMSEDKALLYVQGLYV